jgi:regulator of replication initiation timing
MDILNVVWIEFGSILENIQRLYDNIKQAEDDLRKLYQEAIITTMENSKDEETPEDGSLYPYEDIELYDEIVNLENTISSCRLELEEISEKVIKEYMSYDRNYKITV